MEERKYVIYKPGKPPVKKKPKELTEDEKYVLDYHVANLKERDRLDQIIELNKPDVSRILKEYGQAVRYGDEKLSLVTKKQVKWSDVAKEEIRKLDGEVKASLKERGEYEMVEQHFPRFGKPREIKED